MRLMWAEYGGRTPLGPLPGYDRPVTRPHVVKVRTPTRRSRASASGPRFKAVPGVTALPVRHELSHDRAQAAV